MTLILRLPLVLALCAFALRAEPAAADATTDKNDAIEELLGWAIINGNRAEAIGQALATTDGYVFLVESFFGGIEPIVIKKQDVDAFVGYLQVENLLHPETLDQAIAKAAKAIGLEPYAVEMILKDRKAALAPGGAAGVHERLAAQAAKDRPGIEDYANQLLEEADELVVEAQKIAGSATWPPAKEQTAGKSNVFSPVEVGGVTVDYCLSWATDCGMPVADEFCRRQGFQKSRGFDWTYMKPTKTLRSGETCDADYCGGMTQVVCE